MQDKINILISIAYVGTNYSGWQKQNRQKTVQGEIERVFSKIFNEEIEVIGSGRTDAGVHAQNAKANVLLPLEFTKKHFLKSNKFDFSKLVNSLNQLLPDDIRIINAKKVSLNFNARFAAKKKTYIYNLKCGGILSPFECFDTAFVNQKLNIEKMREASSYLIGEHDFTSFCSAKTAKSRA